jgi:NADH dehydrogenase
VEVFQPADEGAAEAVVATLSRGEVFGEKALLDDAPRGASVRAKTPVDVLVMSRDDFAAMTGQFPVLSDYFGRLMKERYPDRLAEVASLADRMAKPGQSRAP